jgi:selenide, water dikinase
METHDDAGVFRLGPDLALIQTVDFFTPIVDDPFQFGAIAAANAFSDVYAMGGTPRTALNLVGWPQGDLPWDVLGEILKGAHEVVHEAGAVLAGGHSVKAPELFFGLSVTGTVHPDRIVTNAGARPGDVLFLTKPIGTGVLTTALKKGTLSREALALVTATMRRLNAGAAEAMVEVGANAATDVTGFGLLGHLLEMARGSRVAIEIDPSRVPILPEALEHARAGDKPGGLGANRLYASPSIEGASGIDPALLDLLYDPQTSGGLLISVPEGRADQMQKALALHGVEGAARIGRMIGEGSGTIRLIARPS